MNSSKVFFLSEDDNITNSELVTYLHMFHKDTQLIPNVIRVSRKAYANFGMSCYGNNVVLETGKKYALHIFSPFGYIPIIPTDDQRLTPHGFVSIEDTDFDEKFEKIVLGDGK